MCVAPQEPGVPEHPLRTWLREHDRSTEAFAADVGIPSSYLRNVMRFWRVPHAKAAIRIADATGISLDALLRVRLRDPGVRDRIGTWLSERTRARLAEIRRKRMTQITGQNPVNEDV